MNDKTRHPNNLGLPDDLFDLEEVVNQLEAHVFGMGLEWGSPDERKVHRLTEQVRSALDFVLRDFPRRRDDQVQEAA